MRFAMMYGRATKGRRNEESTKVEILFSAFVSPSFLRAFVALLILFTTTSANAAEELLPKYITPQAQKAIKNGLDFLGKQQSPDGNFPNSNDGAEYAVTMTSLAGMAFLANGNTSTRGPYAENVRRVETFVMANANPNGLICT